VEFLLEETMALGGASESVSDFLSGENDYAEIV
jgi:hypothetical protein